MNGGEREIVLRLRTPGEPARDLSGAVSTRVTVADADVLDEPAGMVADVAAEADPASATAAVRAALRPGRRYAVHVHVDRRGDGELAPGDLVGTAYVEADTAVPGEVDVHLTPVLEEPAD